ncbi:membrane protein of unknown function [Nitrospira japonica]|uniref:O-antigen ligase-related domain-containing protein n=1 Tax=Nitrospira japonica TaxID=1325564 RepID=A0A1W1IAE9_9BACT|nr:O-antigen ligase family protein [Nitrospira japonica]SLM49970.1 membrane protein of unknown function [Nitrospira japonica]
MTHSSTPFDEEGASAWNQPTPVPSILTEVGYYTYLFYTLLGAAFGLFVSNLGTGFLLLLLILCVFQLRFRFLTVIHLAAFPLSCAATYVLIQLVVHDEPLLGTVRSFILWGITLLVVQSLALKTNFLRRFAWAAFFIGIAFIPFIQIFALAGGYQRLGLDRAVGYANPNSMAEWYGFCAVYFSVLAFLTKRNLARLFSWLAASVCLYMVTLAVSRATLVAVVVAILIAGRHLLKHGLLPILMLACLTGIVVELGLFGEAVRSYGARGTEETGRLAVWPLVLESFVGSPLVGVGESHTGAMVDTGRYLTPHNCLLFLAQASGIIPLVLFSCYLLQAARVTFLEDLGSTPEGPFSQPLVIYTLLFVQSGDFDFMMPVATVALATPLAASLGQTDRAVLQAPRGRSLELQGAG